MFFNCYTNVNVLVTPPICIFKFVPSNQISPLFGVVGAVDEAKLICALAVVQAPIFKKSFPLVTPMQRFPFESRRIFSATTLLLEVENAI